MPKSPDIAGTSEEHLGITRHAAKNHGEDWIDPDVEYVGADDRNVDIVQALYVSAVLNSTPPQWCRLEKFFRDLYRDKARRRMAEDAR